MNRYLRIAGYFSAISILYLAQPTNINEPVFTPDKPVIEQEAPKTATESAQPVEIDYCSLNVVDCEGEETKPAIEAPRGSVMGLASYYSREGCLGCSPTMTMANGQPLDDSRLTVAYNDAPLNSFVVVRNLDNGRTVSAQVTDTGGFKRHGKIIDLTVATRDAIGCGSTCRVEVIHDESK